MRLKYLVAALFLAFFLSACGGSSSSKDEAGSSTGVLGDAASRNRQSDVYAKLGLEYMRTGQLDVALQKLHRGLDRDPDNANLHYVIALVYERLGEADSAHEHFQEGLSLEPKNSYIINAYGTFQCKQKNYDEAIKLFKRALENPLYDNPEVAWSNAGYCAAQIPDKEQAETYLRTALRINREYPQALAQMANLMLDKEKYLAARGYLQRYQAVANPTAATLWTCVRVERQLKNKDEEASCGLLLRNKYPDSDETALLRDGY
ncbi:MAG: type IV pilus biogenesis/stability protein PilW [gamma proteobacterium symbiont of Bathyaustriella thionipta]|nr:type IV pilus biogenesis/stability protein PilW [gamma proteobacterium symbiont of Bathyaustriella thionipta]